MNDMVPTKVSIQRPIDFTRTNPEFDGSYDSFIAKHLYLLEQNFDTGDALYILDCQTDSIFDKEKRTFLLSFIDGRVLNCPISKKDMSKLPFRFTLPCIASNMSEFISILPKKIQSDSFDTLENFKEKIASSSRANPLITTLYENKDNASLFLSTFYFNFAECQAILNRSGKLVAVFVKLKKETEFGPLIYFQKIDEVFDTDTCKNVTDVIRHNLKKLASTPTGCGMSLQLSDGRKFASCPVNVFDSRMCKAFMDADIIVANYGETGFLGSIVCFNGPIQCLKDKKIIFNNHRKFLDMYQDCNDCSVNPDPVIANSKIHILDFPTKK